MKNRSTCIFLLLLCFIHLRGYAQLDQTLRLELPLSKSESNDNIYEVTPVGNDGLLLSIRENNPFGRKKSPWTFYRYDTTFHEVWKKEYPINIQLIPIKSFCNHQYLFILLTEPESLDISVLRVGIENGDIEMFEGTLIAAVDISDFKVLENQAYIAGIVKNRPVVVSFSFFDLRPRILPGLYGANTEINGLLINEENRTVSVVMYTIHRNNCQMTVKTFSYEGKLVSDIIIKNEKEISLVTAKISTLDENEKTRLLMGNYSVDCTPYSQGMYLAKIKNENREFIRYFKFADFKNFFNYMKPSRQERMKSRILKKREKGKELRLHYRLLIHDIIKSNDQFILVAEAYYPQYRSGSYGGYYGRGTFNDRIFDGYRFTHAIVCGFDKQGNLLWDNSFEILDHTSYDLQEVVQVSIEKDRVVLVYPQEGTINTKVIKGNHILKSKENYKIMTNHEHDKVVDSEPANVSSWYGNYFLAWGTQQINNGKDHGVSHSREVFYLNKITYLDDDVKQGNSQLNNAIRN